MRYLGGILRLIVRFLVVILELIVMSVPVTIIYGLPLLLTGFIWVEELFWAACWAKLWQEK